MAERRALVISPEAPYPVVGGGALRTASLLECLAGHYRVDLVLFTVDWDSRAALPPGKFGETLLLRLPAHSASLPARALRNAARLARGVPPLVDRFAGFEQQIAAFLQDRHYDLGVVEHFWCAPYARILRRHCGKLALDLHNVESSWHARLAASEPWPYSTAHRRFGEAYRRLEAEWLNEFDTLLATSAADAALLDRQAVIYPNSIPYVKAPDVTPGLSVVFSGNLEYHPNLQAIAWFHRHVWPQLSRQWKGLKWRILGKNAHALPPELARDPGIHITGAVEDSIIEIAASRAAVVPLLSGSGTRIKIIEAWAAGAPVVSTRLGAEGLDAVDGEHLLLADTPADFAAAVSRVLSEPALAARLAASGRRLYEENHTWEAAWRALAPIGWFAGLR
ncbi:MAG: glycosyltransferase family 4 protein [Bryobacteraceae bacterium]|nr:glycosyltransferase family 4 protein [Bryobacteraceae bacterium]